MALRAKPSRPEPSGSLDRTFAADGSFNWNYGPGIERAFDLAIQSADGKIVATGMADGLSVDTNTRSPE